jgi:hypothetical protein
MLIDCPFNLKALQKVAKGLLEVEEDVKIQMLCDGVLALSSEIPACPGCETRRRHLREAQKRWRDRHRKKKDKAA